MRHALVGDRRDDDGRGDCLAEHRRRGRDGLDAAQHALAQAPRREGGDVLRERPLGPRPAGEELGPVGIHAGDGERLDVGERQRSPPPLNHLSSTVQMTPGSALTVRATPTQRITSALSGGQRADEPALERDAAEGAPREHGDEADAGDRGGEAEAERGDQREAEADAVERDRREQHDERRGAGQEPRRDADAEDAARA